MFLLYRDIFVNKIRYGSKILVDTNEDNITLNKTLISTRKLTIENRVTVGLYDYIIMENITKNSPNVNVLIENVKRMLKGNGIIMFINDICLSRNYISDTLLYYTCAIVGLNYDMSYLSDIFTLIHENDLKVIDNYRLETKTGFLYSKDVFLISCINRF